ncbi:3-ketoacyl-ACP reductase [Dictyobacter alpinus]|uniref:3-ketoacyl-ACP reductase n=1 Tax=Dictyobacter alpinus TaxID=2014873 RepID=A0A402BHT2_9CHLR|nr:SDR family oxidoreductase [Dictyobacter alpinus]GCE30933.1 3-ketoacyl-ACP reductase [Dictyobacter alpinus]
MAQLNGKVAIVTGASRGIGRAIAQRLGQDGATVVITYIKGASQAADVVTAIQGMGSEAIAVQSDVRQLADIHKLFEQTVQRFGKVDILVNNAAGINIFKPTAEMTVEEYNSMFDLTRGVYFTLQEAAQRLNDNGRIVSISTGGTDMSMAAGGAYAGSKAAIEQFSMALAKEIGARGITVNTVSPGVTQTDGLVLSKEQTEMLVAQTPLGRLGQPEDIASTIAWLVSDDAAWITGQRIRATGGIV